MLYPAYVLVLVAGILTDLNDLAALDAADMKVISLCQSL
jgi:hypothetical protein